jgi:hypothetical protein
MVASILKKGRRNKEKERKKEDKNRSLSFGEFADILGKIRIHSIHRSRRFPKSMERDGWEIRG